MTTTDELVRVPAQPDNPAWIREYAAILQAYARAGGVPEALRAAKVAALVVSANRVLAMTEVPGVQLEAESLSDGVRARILIAPGTQMAQPIHLCFGMLEPSGVQHIVAEYDVGEGANVTFLAHCSFPNAFDLQHLMDATIRIGRAAALTYNEAHYHGTHGGIRVEARTSIQVESFGQYISSFRLVHGRVGRLLTDYTADVGAGGVADLATMVYGIHDDEIEVHEMVRLNEEGARGLAKTRIAVRDHAHSRVFTTAEGNAPGARGHMDCAEIVRGAAVAENVPTVVVRSDGAHVTHEAAIGSVNRKELETLMARGLDEDAAVDVIIRGMLGA